MRFLFTTAWRLAFAALILGGLWLWHNVRLYPKSSMEVVDLTPEKTQLLQLLLGEEKFGPHDFPPLGYTGTESAEECTIASTAVDAVISEILADPSRRIRARMVSSSIAKAMRAVRLLPTEDRDRTAGYMLEIWYILGFRGATGRFAYGAAYPLPEGYGEPLPPGWTSPTEPRAFSPSP